MRPTEDELRRDILRFGRLCYERRLLVAFDGNLSARLPSGDVLCTRSGAHKGLLTDDDLIVVDMEGRRKRGEGRPTSELLMHLACYRARPDVQAVIHAHPPISVGFTLAGISMTRCVLPEVVLTLGTVPTVPYATTGSRELAEKVGEYARDYDAMLMDAHGAVTVGRSLLEAFARMETLEQMATILKVAHDLGGIRELPPEEALRLRRMGLARYGGPPGQDPSRPDAGLPPECVPPAPPAEPELEDVPPLRAIRIATAPLKPFAGATPADEPGPGLPSPEELARRELVELVAEEVLRAVQREGR